MLQMVWETGLHPDHFLTKIDPRFWKHPKQNIGEIMFGTKNIKEDFPKWEDRVKYLFN